MLVLSRKLGETIVIGDDIVVRVASVQGNRVKLAIEAPQSRRIMRGEIAGQQVGDGALVAPQRSAEADALSVEARRLATA